MAEIFVRYIMIKKDVNKEEFQLIDKVKQFFKENYDIDQLEGIINIEKGELSYYIKPNSDATRWETNLSIARLVKSKLNSVFKRFLPILTSVMNYCKISQNIVLFWVQIG